MSAREKAGASAAFDFYGPQYARFGAPRAVEMRREVYGEDFGQQGWRTLAAAVDRVRQELRERGIEPVLAARHWTLPGEVAFYGEAQPIVYSLGPLLGDRHSQYDLWRPNPVADPHVFAGRTFVLIGVTADAARSWFERVEPSAVVVHYDQGHPVATWYITVARGYRGGTARNQGRGY